MNTNASKAGLRRRTVLAGLGLAALLAAGPALAQDRSGELVVLQWQGGSDAEMWGKLEADFAAKNPGVTVRELVVTGQGDMRGPMRTAQAPQRRCPGRTSRRSTAASRGAAPSGRYWTRYPVCAAWNAASRKFAPSGPSPASAPRKSGATTKSAK